MIRRLFGSLVLPPTNCLLIAVFALVIWRKRPRTARALLIFAGVALWAFCTPAVGGLMLRTLQVDQPLDLQALPGAQAIVVLSAGARADAPSFGRAAPDWVTLERLRYAAALYTASGRNVPILTAGGSPKPNQESLAKTMKYSLETEYGVPVSWVDEVSQNTSENAAESARILKEQKVTKIYLVTHGWHMPRARASFERAGFEVVAAPTALRGPAYSDISSLVPSWQGLRDSYHALHEHIGSLFYAVFRL